MTLNFFFVCSLSLSLSLPCLPGRQRCGPVRDLCHQRLHGRAAICGLVAYTMIITPVHGVPFARLQRVRCFKQMCFSGVLQRPFGSSLHELGRECNSRLAERDRRSLTVGTPSAASFSEAKCVHLLRSFYSTGTTRRSCPKRSWLCWHHASRQYDSFLPLQGRVFLELQLSYWAV